MVNLRELLAAFAHDDQWTGWMLHLFKKCSINDDGSYTIPAEYIANLWQLMDTPYLKLSEEQKDNDRAEADRMLAIMKHDTLAEEYHKVCKEKRRLLAAMNQEGNEE